MTKLYLLFFVTLIIFLITTEIISFRYISSEKFHTLKVDFNIFGITFIKDKQPQKKKKRKKRRLPLPSLRILYSFIKSLLAKATVEINSCNLNFNPKTPLEYAYKKTVYSSIFFIILSYLHNYAKSVQYNNTDASNKNEDHSGAVDIKVSVNLIFLLFSALTLAINYIKEITFKKWQRAE